MPTVVTFTPLRAPEHLEVDGHGRMFNHSCEDAAGLRHRQRLPLGSVRGIMYVDALCLHCGAHFIWIDSDEPSAQAPLLPAETPQE